MPTHRHWLAPILAGAIFLANVACVCRGGMASNGAAASASSVRVPIPITHACCHHSPGPQDSPSGNRRPATPGESCPHCGGATVLISPTQESVTMTPVALWFLPGPFADAYITVPNNCPAVARCARAPDISAIPRDPTLLRLRCALNL